VQPCLDLWEGVVYNALVIAFGIGVWRSVQGSRVARVDLGSAPRRSAEVAALLATKPGSGGDVNALAIASEVAAWHSWR
jgi:hypothetical protein